MTNLERKVDLLVALALADDCASRDAAKKALLTLQAEPHSTRHHSLTAERVVEDAVRELGIPCSLIGHQYVVTAVCMVVKTPGLVQEMTKGVYPAVADMFQATSHQVERAIRHAIEVACDRCDPDTLYGFFGNTISKYKSKPTNSEFISQVAAYVRRRLGL